MTRFDSRHLAKCLGEGRHRDFRCFSILIQFPDCGSPQHVYQHTISRYCLCVEAKLSCQLAHTSAVATCQNLMLCSPHSDSAHHFVRSFIPMTYDNILSPLPHGDNVLTRGTGAHMRHGMAQRRTKLWRAVLHLPV
ncbi:hypothetical protein M011DRAFT_220173 [Sporormia fimetaria CBS 119925]|uniref:Uncharacterized protein n=1 Tax=Sporormia fimetaria CBS 119925 TaxID=1340428 RepID=A0A6A6V0X6_9PLEO|nr:hypothetical protein M011DRAFT_220173 [Sporormia fimetaria CBS 119925]